MKIRNLVTTQQPKKTAQKSDKNQNAHMPSSTAMSENIFNCTEGGKDSSVPDNYEEGWYQDEYGNWLNQFDWKQVQLLQSRHSNVCNKNQFFRENVGDIAFSELIPRSNERYENSTFYGPFRFLIFIVTFNK